MLQRTCYLPVGNLLITPATVFVGEWGIGKKLVNDVAMAGYVITTRLCNKTLDSALHPCFCNRFVAVRVRLLTGRDSQLGIAKYY
jgi:hypothetical protein